jgi:hypothetical protein
MPSLRLSWIRLPGFFAGSPLSGFAAASAGCAFPFGRAFPWSASFGSRPSGKPLLRSPPSTGRFHAAQGRQCRSPSELCIAPPCRDAYLISFESSFRRLAHTERFFALDQNLHLPARAGNVHFQFVTGLPTERDYAPAQSVNASAKNAEICGYHHHWCNCWRASDKNAPIRDFSAVLSR